MKTFTLSLMSLFIVAGLSAHTVDSRLHARTSKSEVAKQEIFTHPAQKTPSAKTTFVGKTSAEQTELWKPKTGEFFSFEEGEWVPMDASKFEYDQNGNITTEDNGMTRTENKYNVNNMIIERVVSELQEDNTWLLSVKKSYQYDERVTDFIVDQQFFNWKSETKDWEVSYHHRWNITRNAKGNVTEMLLELYYNNAMVNTERYEIIYNDRDLADCWIQSAVQGATDTTLIEKFRCSNITWNNTDGQLVRDFNSFTLGNNRIKKADISIDGAPYGTFECKYDQENLKSPDFEFTFASTDLSEVEKHSFVQTDDNGSSKETITILIVEDGVENILRSEYMVAMMDEYKNILSQEYYMDEGVLVDGLKLDYTYDPDKSGAYTQILTSMFDPELGDYITIEKAVYSDFINVSTSGINNPSVNQPSYWMQNGQLVVDTDQFNSYRIYNSNGQLVAGAAVAGESLQIPINQLSKGIYTLMVIGNNANYKIKFVK